MASPLVDELLGRGLDDWVSLAEVVGLVRQAVPQVNEEDLQENCVALIRDVVDAGLMTLGEVSDGGFFEWQEPLDEAIGRIREAWDTKPETEWWFACWLANTPAGDSRARSLNSRDPGER
jgi:hypothetical protein